MSALPPKADIRQGNKSGHMQCSKLFDHLVGANKQRGGIVRLSAFAVLGFAQRRKYGVVGYLDRYMTARNGRYIIFRGR